ncbi:MAG: Gfo/Idh/MocA family protein [Parvicellaceae bacterium]|nr:MAG: oxidoreductase [Bacteroidetes bacterium MED-G20]CAI8170930.1 MAG: scyllo-inositol 2-dehydrogenase (NAD(+)) [Crocinitomicaceae bacterium]
MYKIGVVGAGHLGKIHLKILQNAPFVNLVGFFDSDPKVRKEIKSKFNIKSFESYQELIDNSDIVDIVTPTLSHFNCAKEALRSNKHVFIEKPVTHTIEEVKKLIKLAQTTGRKVQVGHVERFNPAFTEAQKLINQPRFIEVHRLAQFNSRGTDVSVIHDLMIHDLDIVLHVVKSPVKSINASGVSVLSNTPDIANARIEFINGCVANITSSRMSLNNVRKSRFFQKNAYVSVDFLNRSHEFIRLDSNKIPSDKIVVTSPNFKPKESVIIQTESVSNINPIEEELKSFLNSIESNVNPTVDLKAAQMALQLTTDVMEQITMGQN